MKLRLSGNTLRFRLGKSDVQQFLAHGRVSSVISFGRGRDQAFCYSVAQHAHGEPGVRYRAGSITVYLSAEQVAQLQAEQQDGANFDVETGDGDAIRVSVERDYKCLHPRTYTDESDSFANTLESHCR